MPKLKPWHLIAGVVAVVLIGWSLVSSIRSNARWKEQARVADSTAKATQRDRARILAQGRADSAIAVSLGLSVARLTQEADAARARAHEAARDAREYQRTRDRAIAALRGAGSLADSVLALVGKSAADDSVIAAQGRVIDERAHETSALRTALDSANTARLVLTSALDSARAQLRRDGVAIQQLQTVLKAARPNKEPRLSALALSLGVGYCAAPGLQTQVCGAAVVGPSLRLF